MLEGRHKLIANPTITNIHADGAAVSVSDIKYSIRKQGGIVDDT